MLKTAVWATCDKCGRECSHITEKTFEIPNGKKTQVANNFFSYWEIILESHDSRFGNGERYKFVLCGDCSQRLVEWIGDKEVK